MLIDTATSIKKILTVEENTVIGGFGSGVMEMLSEERIDAVVRRVGIPDMFLLHGAQDTLREKIGLNTEGIKSTIRQWLKNG
jgi:1-deoxy-D-xylulose-5-phosphate synthase